MLDLSLAVVERKRSRLLLQALFIVDHSQLGNVVPKPQLTRILEHGAQNRLVAPCDLRFDEDAVVRLGVEISIVRECRPHGVAVLVVIVRYRLMILLHLLTYQLVLERRHPAQALVALRVLT